MKTARFLRSVLAVAAFPLLMAGCADDGTVYDSVTTLKPGGAAYGYVLNEAGTASLLQFSLSTGGAVSPQATLTLPANFAASAVAIDPASGVLYVGGIDPVALTSEILVYPAGSAGVATPSATILPVNKDFAEPLAMTVDAAGKLYVVSSIPAAIAGGGSDLPTIAVFASGANGAATPTKTIAGAATGLYLPTDIAVDKSGNLYVSNADPSQTPYAGVIAIFNASATGNAAPLRAITNLKQVFNGVAVDAQQNVYAVQETQTVTNGVSSFSNPAIVEFSAGATGPATPVKTISGSSASLAVVGNIQVDSAGNIYVVNQTQANVAGSGGLLGFSPAASGNQTPALTITSSAITAGAAPFAVR